MELHSRRAGQGKPVVLIHGLFGSLENLGGIARQLAEHHTVYSLDLPNHGRSPHTDTTSLMQMAEAVYEWMQRENLLHASLIGHSLGGKVAMELALTHPQRVDRLAVLDIAPVHYEPHHHQVFKGLLTLNLDDLPNRARADEVMAEHVEETAVRSFLLKNLVREDGRYRWRMNLSALHNCYGRLVSGNRVARYTGKTLFLKGSHSDYIGPQYKDEILSRFPAAQVRVVADTGHWLHADKPDLVARLLLRFLQTG